MSRKLEIVLKFVPYGFLDIYFLSSSSEISLSLYNVKKHKRDQMVDQEGDDAWS